MPSFYDVIEQDDCEVTENTTFYLVKHNAKFFIKAISRNIDQLISDPITGEKVYWLVNTKNLLTKVTNNPDIKNLIFPNGKLTIGNLPSDKIEEYLGLVPNQKNAKSFNLGLAQEIKNEANRSLLRDDLNSIIERQAALQSASSMRNILTLLLGPNITMQRQNASGQPARLPRYTALSENKSNNPSPRRLLNIYERNALQCFQGLTAEMFRSANSNVERFSANHFLALGHLVLSRIPADLALQCVAPLSPDEAAILGSERQSNLLSENSLMPIHNTIMRYPR